MRVLDFFCGAGGFSEGLKQMGFEIVFALDNWNPAVDSFKWNNPEAEVLKEDITRIDPRELPTAEVMIGGPPCTTFSFANKGGRGDRQEGMRLVLAFLRLVYLLKPRYWIMENVPRLLETLPERIPLEMIGIDKGGYLHIPKRQILLSADFGAPQKRFRLFSGNFPTPAATHGEAEYLSKGKNSLRPWKTVQDVFNSLPSPHSNGNLKERIHDPNYLLAIPQNMLTDHYYDTTLTEEEVRQNSKSKTDHSWYGKMSFPDRTDRPARTVMATQLRVSRETMVFATEINGMMKYRRPTIRECACFQTFPITYQFVGDSEATKIKLAGNAVACKVAAAIASRILEVEDRPRNKVFLVGAEMMRPAPPAKSMMGERKSNHRRPKLDRGFRDHIPGSRVSGLRVDFDNGGESPSIHPRYTKSRSRHHLVEWVTRLYAGSGKSTTSEVINIEVALNALEEAVQTHDIADALVMMLNEIEEGLVDRIPDATTLQGLWTEQVNGIEETPYWLIERLAQIINKHFTNDEYDHLDISGIAYGDFINGRKVPVRTAVTVFAMSLMCEVINKGSKWLKHNREVAFIPLGWPEPEIKNPGKQLAVILSTKDVIKRLSAIKKHEAEG